LRKRKRKRRRQGDKFIKKKKIGEIGRKWRRTKEEEKKEQEHRQVRKSL